MAVLKYILPQAKSSVNSSYDHSNQVEVEVVLPLPLPPYLKRAGFKPLKPEDLGNGGALPEFHCVQYPLGMGMGMTKNSNNTLPLTVDDCGKLRYDTIVRQYDNSAKKMIVYSQHSDLVPVFAKDNIVEKDEVDDKQKEIDETTRHTKAALEQIANVRLSVIQPKNVAKQSSDSKCIKYRPSQLQSAAFNSGAKERIIRMVEMPVDPLEPPNLKHKRLSRVSSDSPPVPVMHSPPRPLTVKDQQEWNKIPPCISNWKNPKGYTIPLDKRLANDARGLQEVQINENFAKLAEALYVGAEKNREAVEVRSKVQKEMMMKEKENKEMELRVLAHKARSERSVAGIAMPCERSGGANANDGDMSVDYERVEEETREEKDERIRREKIREERRRERGRERRVEDKDAALGKKSKISRDRDRDISEKVALGMASIGAKVVYDERVFNQEKGMDSGFGRDDAYNIYDKGMFTCWQSALYRPKKDTDDEMYGGADNDEQLDKIKKTERFKVDRVFTGTDNRRSGRQRDNRHVEFDKEEVADQEDPFCLDQFLTEVKMGHRQSREWR